MTCKESIAKLTGAGIDDIFVAVMGVTGAGKSTFIKRVTGREDIAIGHGINSRSQYRTCTDFCWRRPYFGCVALFSSTYAVLMMCRDAAM